MTALPEQLRRQKEAIDAHFNQSVDGNQPDPDTQVNDEPVVENDPTPVAQPPQATQHAEEETFAQRYYTLQGIHRADTSRLTAQLNEASTRIQQLENLLSAMPSTPAQPEPNRAVEATRLLTEQERNEYGESLDVMRKVTREELTSLVNRLNELENNVTNVSRGMDTIVPQMQQVTRAQAETVQQSFWRQLTDAVPNWQAVNVDPDWHAWLLSNDPLYGGTRQSMLEVAQNNWDAPRVIAFFNAFMGNNPKYSSNKPTQTTRSTPANELEQQVAPGRPRNATAPNGQQAKVYTRAEISRFFDEVRQGKYKGLESERNRIERDIFAATSEGRVVAQ